MLVLVRLATNDAWAALAEGASNSHAQEGCVKSAGECGAPYAVTSLYFISFVGIVSMIMINLIVSIILDNFELLQVRPVVLEGWTRCAKVTVKGNF